VLFVPESRDEENSGKLDLLGAALATTSLGAIVYSLIQSSTFGWQNSIVLASLVSGILLLGLFVLVEARKRIRCCRSIFFVRAISPGKSADLFLYSSLAGTLFFLPLNLIQVQRYSATAAGAATLPFILIMFGLSRWSGGLGKALRFASAAGDWTGGRRIGIRAFHATGRRRELLDRDFFRRSSSWEWAWRSVSRRSLRPS
jgi:hypothetical protein